MERTYKKNNDVVLNSESVFFGKGLEADVLTNTKNMHRNNSPHQVGNICNNSITQNNGPSINEAKNVNNSFNGAPQLSEFTSLNQQPYILFENGETGVSKKLYLAISSSEVPPSMSLPNENYFTIRRLNVQDNTIPNKEDSSNLDAKGNAYIDLECGEHGEPTNPTVNIHDLNISISQALGYYQSNKIQTTSAAKLPPLAMTSDIFNPSIDQDDCNSGCNLRSRRFSHEPRVCPVCGRSFKYPSDLKKHEQIHTEVKKFVCQDCGRNFRRLHQLNVHRRIHTGEKPYICNICGMSFRHDSTLTMHTRTRHQNLKPFKCSICNKMFGRLSHLRKHQRYVCATTRRQKTPNNLDYYQGEQYEDYPYECEKCSVFFADETSYLSHLNACFTDNPDKEYDSNYAYNDPHSIISDPGVSPRTYSCKICETNFSTFYDYEQHHSLHASSYINKFSPKDKEQHSLLDPYGHDFNLDTFSSSVLDNEIRNLSFPHLLPSNQIQNISNFNIESSNFLCEVDAPSSRNSIEFTGQTFINHVPPDESHMSSVAIETIMKETPYIGPQKFTPDDVKENDCG